jgi:hypothetical protein
MKIFFYSFFNLVLIVMTCVSCDFLFLSHGVRKDAKTKIIFQFEDGKPVSSSPVYIDESFGESKKITEFLKTDGMGAIVISGSYCLPMMVAVDGGSFVVNERNRYEDHVVTVNSGKTPTLQQALGNIDPEIDAFKDSQFYRNCGG